MKAPDEIVWRRMRNTGESEPEARDAISREMKRSVAEQMAQSDWVDAWTESVPWKYDQDAVDWLRSRPDSIRKLIFRFPPSSVVRAVPGRTLNVPLSDGGRVRLPGIVQGYYEGGLIAVRAGPRSDRVGQCKAEWLEILGYYQGLTPERVMEIMGVETV